MRQPLLVSRNHMLDSGLLAFGGCKLSSTMRGLLGSSYMKSAGAFGALAWWWCVGRVGVVVVRWARWPGGALGSLGWWRGGGGVLGAFAWWWHGWNGGVQMVSRLGVRWAAHHNAHVAVPLAGMLRCPLVRAILPLTDMSAITRSPFGYLLSILRWQRPPVLATATFGLTPKPQNPKTPKPREREGRRRLEGGMRN